MVSKTTISDFPYSDFVKARSAFAYYRLSREEAQRGESASISNQKKIVEAYCKQNGIVIVRSLH